MTFGEKLKALRKEKKLSQAALAEMIGTTKITIHRYESGNFYPRDRKTYSKLAEALGCSEYYLKSEDMDPALDRILAYQKALSVQVTAPDTSSVIATIDYSSRPENSAEQFNRVIRAYMTQFILSDKKLSDEEKTELCERITTWSPANH